MADFPDNVFDGSIADLNSIVNSTVANIPLKQGKITKQELQDALTVYPILSFLNAPDKETEGEPFQLAISNAEKGYSLWICGGADEETGEYNWHSVANDTVDLSEYVLNSLTIAGIDLSDNITADELRKSLEAQRVIVDSNEPPEAERENYAEIGDLYFRKLSLQSKLYLCVGKTENPESIDEELDAYLYNWLDLTSNEVDLSGYVPTSRKIAGIDLADDITIEEIQDKLSVGYIRSLDGAPNNETVGKVGEIIFTTEWNTSTGAKNIHKIYRCNRINEAEGNYEWTELTYVPISRKVAGLVLENDITVEQLQTALGINVVTSIDENSTDKQIASAKAVYDLFNSIVNGNEVSY